MCAVSPLPSDDDISAQNHHHGGYQRSGTISPRATEEQFASAEASQQRNNANENNASRHISVHIDDIELDGEVRSSLTVSSDLLQPPAAAAGHSSSSSSSGRSRKEESQEEEETEPGKLVSITPDIVKPVKEVKNSEDDAQTQVEEQKESIKEAFSAAEGSPCGLLKSGSSGQLPDMLTHTPDGQQQQQAGSLTRGVSAGGPTVVVMKAATPVAAEGEVRELQLTTPGACLQFSYCSFIDKISQLQAEKECFTQ